MRVRKSFVWGKRFAWILAKTPLKPPLEVEIKKVAIKLRELANRKENHLIMVVGRGEFGYELSKVKCISES